MALYYVRVNGRLTRVVNPPESAVLTTEAAVTSLSQSITASLASERTLWQLADNALVAVDNTYGTNIATLTSGLADEITNRNTAISTAVTALSGNVTASFSAEASARTSAISAAVSGLASTSYVDTAVGSVVGGINDITGDVFATGVGSQAATVKGMGGSSSKTHFVIKGGKYNTLQQAVDAAAHDDLILVGPPDAGSSWGDVTFVGDKRLFVVGLGAKHGQNVAIGKVTYAPTTGANVIKNEVWIRNVFISGNFSSSPAVVFGGDTVSDKAARLRIQDSYIYNTGTSGDVIVVKNQAAGSSLYIDNSLIQAPLAVSGSGAVLKHVKGYTYVKGSEFVGGGYAVDCAAGNLVMMNSTLELNGVREIARVTGGLLSFSFGTMTNSTVSGSGVNLTTAGATLAMGYSGFVVANGPGYCVNGVAGTYYLNASVNYSDTGSGTYNKRVKNLVTSIATATTPTSAA
jgi:hypothetical protein